MNKKERTEEKLCAFYASDYHFEMISLPYIQSKMEENKEIIIITENDLEKTINVLISNMKLKEETKRLLNIDWNHNDLNKFKEIKQKAEQKKNLTIFIKGKENYIENINKNIEKWVEKTEDTTIVNCYDIEEVVEKMGDIISGYNKMLNTSGEKAI